VGSEASCVRCGTTVAGWVREAGADVWRACPCECETEQPMPVPNTEQPVYLAALALVARWDWLRCPDAIRACIEARVAVGRERYGVELQPHNGRDAARDCAEEAADALMYATQRAQETRGMSRLRWEDVACRAATLLDAVFEAQRWEAFEAKAGETQPLPASDAIGSRGE
jgi:hypothetical protein